MRSAVVVAGGAVVVLIRAPRRSRRFRFIEHFGPGVQHVAFLVRDMDEAMERLGQSGGDADTPEKACRHRHSSSLRRHPGSGVRVELIERSGGNFSDACRAAWALGVGDLY